ncbi:MAG: DUF4124 domain-containing protein [Gammaproteobacteria bacterium]|nr:DUF4124 domain-containing protein [Gammaproteobacteria bacterium]
MPGLPQLPPLLLLLALTTSVAAEVYRWTDEQGNVHFSDCPPEDCARQLQDAPPTPSPEDVQRAQERLDRVKQFLRKLDAQREAARADPDSNSTSGPPSPPPRSLQPVCFSDANEWLGAERSQNSFDPISPEPLQSGTHAMLGQLLAGLEGRWDGFVEEYICRGTKAQPQLEHVQHRAELRATSRPTFRVLMESSLRRVDNGVARDALLWLYLNARYLHAGDLDRSSYAERRWVVEIVEAQPKRAAAPGEEKRVIFMRKCRKTQASSSTWHMEVRSIRLQQDELRIDELFFVQNVLAGRRHWQMNR